MGINIIVCAKQVPDPEGPPSSFEINAAERKVTARGIPPVINPFDENALEAAIRIKETAGAEITLLSLGKGISKAVILKAVAAGADASLLVEGEALDAALLDSFATARLLAAAIGKAGRVRPHPLRPAGGGYQRRAGGIGPGPAPGHTRHHPGPEDRDSGGQGGRGEGAAGRIRGGGGGPAGPGHRLRRGGRPALSRACRPSRRPRPCRRPSSASRTSTWTLADWAGSRPLASPPRRARGAARWWMEILRRRPGASSPCS